MRVGAVPSQSVWTNISRSKPADPAQPKTLASPELTSTERREVDRLKARDAEVRRHEQTHLQTAGAFGKGPPKFEYEEGPDGKLYAVGGHVEIDTAPVSGNPEATLKKAETIRKAALAPNDPSSQDRKIAREAEQMAREAQADLQRQRLEETRVVAEKAKASQKATGYSTQGELTFEKGGPILIDTRA